MEPHVDSVRFGTITVAGQTFKHDIVITLDGEVRKREKRLSKQLYGTSHTVSQAEIETVWEKGAEALIVGTGLFDRVRLSPEAQFFLAQQGCAIESRRIRQAVRLWNDSRGKVVGLFHITC